METPVARVWLPHSNATASQCSRKRLNNGSARSTLRRAFSVFPVSFVVTIMGKCWSQRVALASNRRQSFGWDDRKTPKGGWL